MWRIIDVMEKFDTKKLVWRGIIREIADCESENDLFHCGHDIYYDIYNVGLNRIIQGSSTYTASNLIAMPLCQV